MAEYQAVADAAVSETTTREFTPSSYVDSAFDLARRAGRASETEIDRTYRVGGRTVRFRFAGAALLNRIAPALEHLATDPDGSPHLSVTLWDSASTGVTMLPPPWQEEELRVNGEIPSFIEAGYYAHYNVYHNALILFSRDRRRATYWIRDAEHVPDHETASPLFALFQAWLSQENACMVHAAAVGFQEGGALLVGECGSGKSNTSLACLGSELLHAGDDRCIVTTEPKPFVHSLYSTAKTHPEDIRRYPFLERELHRISYLESGKALYMLNDLFPEKLISGFPLRVILLPHVTGRRDTSLSRGSAAAGLKMLAPYAMLRWPSTAGSSFRMLADLFKRVPCYRLDLGTDIEQIPAAIAKVLRSA